MTKNLILKPVPWYSYQTKVRFYEEDPYRITDVYRPYQIVLETDPETKTTNRQGSNGRYSTEDLDLTGPTEGVGVQSKTRPHRPRRPWVVSSEKDVLERYTDRTRRGVIPSKYVSLPRGGGGGTGFVKKVLSPSPSRVRIFQIRTFDRVVVKVVSVTSLISVRSGLSSPWEKNSPCIWVERHPPYC